MSYNTSIPNSADPRAQSQQQIKANYQAINTVFANNHVALNNNLQGMHRVLTMRPQLADPATGATQVALYNKLDGSSLPEIFFRPKANATPIQLTYSSLNTTLAAAQQYSFVAGPFVVYGGLIKAATKGQVVTLSPATTLLYVGLTCANITSVPTIVRSAAATNVSGASFTIDFKTGLLTDIYYLAIGQ